MKLINNQDVASLVKMDEIIDALENAYRAFFDGRAVCRPRIDIEIPGQRSDALYRWGSMEGGMLGGYFAIRCKSDMIFHEEKEGLITQEKYCVEPGTFCGFILLFSIENGEPLALINDGVIQHMRVAADGAIGIKYASRPDAKHIGLLGSGGMARDHLRAAVCVRDITSVSVYSPTRENRERFADEMSKELGVRVVPMDTPEKAVQGADILMGCTDSAIPVIKPEYLEPGQHVINIGGGGGIPSEIQSQITRFLRFGNTESPVGWEDQKFDDEHLTWRTRAGFSDSMRPSKKRAHREMGSSRLTYLSSIMSDEPFARSTSDITYSERGNLQGNQFHAVAGLVYEKSIAAGRGFEIPTSYFLQDIRN